MTRLHSLSLAFVTCLLIPSLIAHASIKDWDGKDTSLTWMYAAPQNTVNLKTTADLSKVGYATIDASGGNVTAKGADGTQYTLDIPPHALLDKISIKVIPLTQVAGLPFGEGAVGAQLEPSGLQLMKPAILTIRPTIDIPMDRQVFYGFEKSGDEAFLAAPVVQSKEMKIQVYHFSGYGINKGYMTDFADLRTKMGGDIEAKLANSIAEKTSKERVRSLFGQVEGSGDVFTDMENGMKEYYAKVLKPRLALLEKESFTCAEGRLAQRSAIQLLRSAQQLGFFNYDEELTPYIYIEKVERTCMKEEFELCRDSHIIHRLIPLHLENRRYRNYCGQENPEIDDIEKEYIRKCFRFEMEFGTRSQRVSTDPELGFALNGTVLFGYVPKLEEVNGVGDLNMTAISAKYRTNPNCKATATPGNGKLQVTGMRLKTSSFSPKIEEGKLNDIKLSMITGATTEKIAISCTGMPPLPPLSNMWVTVFFEVHKDEIKTKPDDDTLAGIIQQGWTITPGTESLAEKSWKMGNPKKSSDEGFARIYHRPVKD